MARLFEDFLTAALRVELERRHGGRLVAQPADHHLDLGGRFTIRPDLLWRRGGAVAAVIDAKYKRDVPVTDAYQMLAYCTALGLPRGHLVYVTGGPPARHVVRYAGTEIVCHSLDLAQPPEFLLRSVADVADQVAADRTEGRAVRRVVSS
jgi:5-methylcytosine-specific restriction enzyme subunit McrC